MGHLCFLRQWLHDKAQLKQWGKRHMEMQMVLLAMESTSSMLCGGLDNLTSFIYILLVTWHFKIYVEISEIIYEKRILSYHFSLEFLNFIFYSISVKIQAKKKGFKSEWTSSCQHYLALLMNIDYLVFQLSLLSAAKLWTWVLH